MTTLQSAADALDAEAVAQATKLAESLSTGFPNAWQALATEFLRRNKQRYPAAKLDTDGRSARWRVRVRLYNAAHMSEVEADSDPDLPPESAGATVVTGLPGVAEHLAALAHGFHSQPISGLDAATLRHSLKSLRPTLSRRGGNGTWRVSYRVDRSAGIVPADSQKWLARVDVVRVPSQGATP